MDKLYAKYALPLMAYGFIRKTIRMQNAYIEKYVYDEVDRKGVYKKYPLLYVQKGVVVSCSTLLTPCMFPFYIYNDLKTIERKVRSIDDEPTSFWSRKSNVIDHLFE